MQSPLERAMELNNKFGWNVIPMRSIIRNADGSKSSKAIVGWDKWKSEMFDFSEWLDEYKNLAIVHGIISDLTIVDIDSQEAADTILNHLGCNEITELANYVVKTAKGYQLFYRYVPNTPQQLNVRERIDFLNGGLSFADSLNPGYVVLKDEKPDFISEKLKNFVIGLKETNPQSNEIKLFKDALRENSELPYIKPLCFLIQEFVEAKRLSAKITLKLEKVFCSGPKYGNYKISDFEKNGQKYDAIMYVGGIVASNPTVDEELYKSFLKAFSEKVCKIDINDSVEQMHIKNRIAGHMKIFSFNPEWKKKYEELNDPSILSHQIGIETWYDPQDNLYRIYYPNNNGAIETYQKEAFVYAILREAKLINPESALKPADIDVTKITKRYTVFEPSEDQRFFENVENGFLMFNTFERTPLLKRILERNKSKKEPRNILKLISHLLPVDEERYQFLHSLAYHMTYLKCSPTTYIITGKPGTGKNTFLHELLRVIYGSYHLKIDMEEFTGHFKDRIVGKLLVFIDEITPGTEVEKEFAVLLKQIIGNSQIALRQMYKGVGEYKNHSLVLMASNFYTPFKISGDNDRRINIVQTKDENLGDVDLFDISAKDNDKFISMLKFEIQDFVDYLSQIPLESSDYSKIILNKQKSAMIKESVPLVKQYGQALVYIDVATLKELNSELGDFVETEVVKRGSKHITLKDLNHFLGDKARLVTKYMCNELDVIKKIVSLGDGRTAAALIINEKGNQQNDFEKLKEEF